MKFIKYTPKDKKMDEQERMGENKYQYATLNLGDNYTLRIFKDFEANPYQWQ
ncbi:MAG: hypothetical protein LBF81_02210 [Prevotellaceae bacterium]|nr:hypothetical protein [Prevotellaceae bacterium]